MAQHTAEIVGVSGIARVFELVEPPEFPASGFVEHGQAAVLLNFHLHVFISDDTGAGSEGGGSRERGTPSSLVCTSKTCGVGIGCCRPE